MKISYVEWQEKQKQDPAFVEASRDLEPAYQVTRLRIMRGLTQKQLADLVGTKQSSIARLESGRTQPTVSFLRRIVHALGGQLFIHIDPSSQMVETYNALFIGSRGATIKKDSSEESKYSNTSATDVTLKIGAL
jgi:transcriptional regulator with XRE-family HTH domain